MASIKRIHLAWAALVAAGLLAIYLPSLGNGLVFDDAILSNGLVFTDYGRLLPWRPRMLSYGSFVWLQALVGEGWWKQRVVNLLLHAGVVAALWGFYREMLRHVQPARVTTGEAAPDPASAHAALALGLGVFALNPMAVYAVGYLVQRSIVMATLFTVLALWAFARAVAARSPLMLVLALAGYALAIASKEYAIFAPLAAVPVYIMVARPPARRLAILAVAGAAVMGVAAWVLWARYGEILGKPFDEYSQVYVEQLARLDPDAARHAYGLSILNEAWLFFEYGVRWFIPYTGWMSINLRPPFPVTWLSFPQVLGILGYVAVLVGGFWLLLRHRDWRALGGLSLLLPALLFGTEFSTVWVQDPLVLYRSYLWAIGVPGVVYCLVQDAPVKALAAVGVAVVALLTWGSLDRVFSLDTPVAAWSDAIEKLPRDPRAVGRWFPYLNRGSEYVDRNDFGAALQDFRASSALGDLGMGAFDEGSVLNAQGKPQEAIAAFDRAQAEGYRLYNLPFQRGLALASLNRGPEAYEQFRVALAENPPSPTREALLASMGRLGLQLGKGDEAVAALEELLQRQPRNKEGRYLLAMALISRKQPARAKEILDALLMEEGRGPAYYARAMANYGLGHKAEALADIEAALRSAPGNPNLLEWRSRIRAMP
jgi:tetratricopeptide (TPR) repeat protein